VNHRDDIAELTETEPKRAAVYLRVSTVGQVNNDYNPEGISIPAQRDATYRKAAELKAIILADADYVEPGRTGTEIEKRPIYQDMIARIKARRDIDYIIVYQFSRIFRNSLEAAIAKHELRKLGVRIVSASLDLGDTLEAQMVETIVHAVDEYRVKSDAADIRYKMGKKAKNGGTVNRAPLGYRNVRATIDGREVRTVDIDPVRGPLIAWAFNVFATGEWTVEDLCDALGAKGLTTRPGPKTPSKPLHPNTLGAILHNPYYTGVVQYNGARHDGRHAALITPSVFLAVQTVLQAHDQGGSKRRKHDHYLKGSLFCGTCGERLCISPSKGRGGVPYNYAFCQGRHIDRTCSQPYLRVDVIEEAIENYYRSVQRDSDNPDALRADLLDFLADERAQLDHDRADAAKRVQRLRDEQLKLLQAHYAGAVPLELLSSEQDRLTREITRAEETLSLTALSLDKTEAAVTMAVDLAANCHALYLAASDTTRRLLNQAFFAKLFVEADGAVRRSERTRPLGGFLRPDRPLVPVGAGESRDLETSNPETVFWSRGSTTSVLVEVAGIEPASSGEQSGLLRAQRAVVFSAPPVTHASRCRAQSLLGVPKPPRDRGVR
jgi:site-specific DNA recombinase